MRTSCSFDGDVALTVRTFLGSRSCRSFFFFLGSLLTNGIDDLYQAEYGKGSDQEIDHSSDEITICKNGGFLAAAKHYLKYSKIGTAQDHRQYRRQQYQSHSLRCH